MAICAYALDESLPELTGTPAVVFALIKPTLDSGRNKASNRLNKTKSNEEQSENKPKTKREQIGKEKEREKEKESEREKEREVEREGTVSRSALDSALDEFAKARKAMKKPLTDRARELTKADLEKLAPGDEAMQIAIINQSIQRGWQGVFPLKDGNFIRHGDYTSGEELPI